MENGIVSGIWKKTTFYCDNGHEELTEMPLVPKGKALYYSCPCCKNALSAFDAEKVIHYLSDLLYEADINCEKLNLTNHKWKKKTITYKILEHNDYIKILVLNKGEINK